MPAVNALSLRVINPSPRRIYSDGSSDGGTLDAHALIVFVCSATILIIYRREIPVIGQALFGDSA